MHIGRTTLLTMTLDEFCALLDHRRRRVNEVGRGQPQLLDP
jgi:hypothetical protein